MFKSKYLPSSSNSRENSENSAEEPERNPPVPMPSLDLKKETPIQAIIGDELKSPSFHVAPQRSAFAAKYSANMTAVPQILPTRKPNHTNTVTPQKVN